MFAYCGNNPVMFADTTGKFSGLIIGLAILHITGVLLSSCSQNDSTDYIENNPFLLYGRHEQLEDAMNEAINIGQDYASNDEKEVGFYVYEYQGGYYVSRIQGGFRATDHSVAMDPSLVPQGATIMASFHTHLFHNDNLIFMEEELKYIKTQDYPFYVVDKCGCVYCIFPDAKSITDYEVVRCGK